MSRTRELVGRTQLVRTLDDDIHAAAKSDAKVLITGESGVGKEVAAQLVHARSRRARFPMRSINCAGVPDTLLESEFFGYTRGSFTGAYSDRAGLLEAADHGTVFLDEIGEMSLRMQGLLLRFLESGEVQRVGSTRTDQRVDVRIITASNRRLEDEVERKNFREDLFYRLNVVRLHVPPLRERIADLPLLVQHFVEEFCRQYDRHSVQLAPDVVDVLSAHPWPGNVRELRNVVERSIVRLKGDTITCADLPPELRRIRALAAVTPTLAAAVGPRTSDRLFDRMVMHGESFWAVAYEPFMARDLTRRHLRELVSRGLEQTCGNYKVLAELFNIPPEDYKRFVALLRRHQCHVPFQQFRKPMAKVEPPDAGRIAV
jgi:transcriptional regulator with PAS, ATPase and Fis domain